MSEDKSGTADHAEGMEARAAKEPTSHLAPNGYFFMHIAKTAGSFVNDVLRNGVRDKFVDHCEAPGRLDSSDEIAVWSGHIYLPHWRKIEAQKGWKTRCFTLLRDPIAQLASHILWLDHYGQAEFYREYGLLDEGSQQVVDQIRDTDLSDAGDIDRLLISLSGRGIQYLDNCQSRYFIAGGNGIARQDPLHLGMRGQMLEALQSFSVVGVGEQMERFIAQVSNELDVDLHYTNKRVNEARATRSIDTTNPIIRSVLSKRCTLDNWLYRHVNKG